MKTTIKTLYQKGYNKTQIGQMLGIDRKTVRKVLKEDAGCQAVLLLGTSAQVLCRSGTQREGTGLQ